MGIALFARFAQGETFRMSRLRPRWARLCLGGPAFGAGRKVHAAAAAKGVCHKSGKRESICRPQGAGMPRLSAAKGRLPCKEVFFRGKVYSSEKVFTASSPDTAGGPPCGRPLLHAPVFARPVVRAAPSARICLFYAPCAPPCGRAHGALRERHGVFRAGVCLARGGRRRSLTFSSPRGKIVSYNIK